MWGVIWTLKLFLSFFFRPIENLIQKNEFLLNLRYGFLPNLISSFYEPKPRVLKITSTQLMERVREFWYSNIPGDFDLGGEKISRRDIFIYGGPNPEFTCKICQKYEWLSRIRQKNLFLPHSCPYSKKCEDLCKKQGNELWTHYHQNFDFSIGCNFNLNTPKGLFLIPNFSYRNLTPRCDLGFLVSLRRFAYAFQRDIIKRPVNIDWQKYDFLWVFIDLFGQKFSRPNIPVILYGHDFWPVPNRLYQWVIDWIKPDVFLTSYPSQWKQCFKFPSKTKVAFYPLFPSMFFTRSNLKEKTIDLLVIGAISSSVYKSRIELDRQISQLINKYRIEFSHRVGYLGSSWQGPAYYLDSKGESLRYLNKWLEYLGLARYVIFGIHKHPILVWKYYETLGSGAIPIFPEVPDLKLLGVRPFEHYIPLSEVEGNNEKLRYYLDHYEDYKYVAQNAVEWYKSNSDKMLFEDFENLIREITNYKYPKRLI